MDKTKNHELVRKKIIEYTTKILMGPGSEKGTTSDDQEIISEHPSQRYVTGMMYPPDKLDILSLDGEKEKLIGIEEDYNVIDNEFQPKSIGFTFYCNRELSEIEINYKGAFYQKENISQIEIAPEDFSYFSNALEGNIEELEIFLKIDITNKKIILKEDQDSIDKLKSFNKKKREDKWLTKENIVFFSYLKKLESFQKNGGYVRNFYSKKNNFNISKSTSEDIIINDDITVKLYINIKNIDETNKSVTIVVKNISKEILYQNELSVLLKKNDLISVEKISKKNLNNLISDEQQNMLLYRNIETYAVGHGISVKWSFKETDTVYLYTSYLPNHEVYHLKFEIDEAFLSRHNISTNKINSILQATAYIDENIEEQFKNLNLFVSLYELWIKEKEIEIGLLSKELQSIAECNLKKCRESLNRMNSGIQILKNNENALQAFHWAQEAMILQRIKNVSEKQDSYKRKNYDKKIFQWRPFQLAFILNSVESILNENSEERMELDLIWVPTGGGKTEAYLFAIAILIFYRRQTYPVDNDGVSVIMRYTLRLLTAQQFERASALICACDYIRTHYQKQLGKTEISIGLWVGGSSTPNNRKAAKKALSDMMSKNNLSEVKNINNFQVLECPWCNQEDSILPSEEKFFKNGKNNSSASIYWGIKHTHQNDKHNFHCTNKKCHFYKYLPIYVVDEEIYKQRPTLLFGTVDKFARIPLVEEASGLFGSDNEFVRKPELIIQDELHLISGPLGSMVGLYEAAFDKMLSNSGIQPKYIASTATIKNAEEQVKNLFSRKVQQYPPSGLDADDNFFVTKDESKPGRIYVGVMPTGKTQITTEIRLVSSLIQASNDLELSFDERDAYWTVTGYFNSIRELGKMTTLIKDDIDDYLLILRQRNIKSKRNINNPIELTSRIESSKIKDYIAQLKKNCGEKDSVDILTATNMLSVGIDIDRLNSMFVVGQPKTTAEYIQATSRVGRKNPGLVHVLYNSTRSRDRSHYETFQSYHQSLYRYVESTSVTPYSLPALEKGLPAILVAMLRNIKKENIRDVKKITESELNSVKEYLVKRIQLSSGIEDLKGNTENLYIRDAEKEINELLDEWKCMISSNESVSYYLSNSVAKDKSSDTKYLLKDIGIIGYPEAKYAMNSMRDVDQTSYVKIIE